MKKIEPFESVAEALAALDNGGQFYNFLTHAEDGFISTAEASKAAGLFAGKKQVVLFLQLALSKLAQNERDVIISKFDEALTACYQQYRGITLAHHQLNRVEIGTQVLLKGTAKFTADRSDLNGFVFIMAGGAMVPVPIIEAYDVYNFVDDTQDTFPVVHAKGKAQFPDRQMTVAGVVKEIKSEKKGENGKRYLEIFYYLVS